MAFTTKSSGPMSDINVTPLIDVLLVLLIIFLITAPTVAHNVQIDLPQPTKIPPVEDPPPPIDLKVLATGELFWNGQPLIKEALGLQLDIEAAKNPQPELQIDAELNTQYEVVAGILATAKNSHMSKIGFKNMPSAN
jgi:biopolymer transport protein ExbD